MSGIKTVDKLAPRLNSLLPDFVQSESPEFVAFLKAYFEFLEHEIVVLKSQSTIDTLGLEDGSGSVIYETATISPSSQTVNKILHEVSVDNPTASADPFVVGEYVVGSKSQSVAKIDVINGNTIYLKTVHGHGFKKNETILGRTGGQTGIVSSYKESSIRANNKLLEYSDVDTTTEAFLEYFQKDFMPSLDLSLSANKRSTVKHIKDLYQKKGSPESLKFLLRLLYGEEAEITYPFDNTLKASESSYDQERRMVVHVPITENAPEATDTIIQYAGDGETIYAQGIVNIVYPVVGSTVLYSLNITNVASKEFTEGSTVTLMDRTTKEKREGTVKGIIQTFNTENPSVYVNHGDGDILLEDGAGLLLETSNASTGSLYDINDRINFQGAKDDTDAGPMGAIVDGVSSGDISEVYIEAGGTGYEGGDLVIFANAGTDGDGALGYIGSAGDELFQEAGTRFGYHKITATSNGQTVFSGIDDYGVQIIFEDHNRHIYVNDVEQTSGVSTQGSIITFASGLNSGDVVEVYTEYMRLLYENGDVINLETTSSHIRKITLINNGTGYNSLPLCGPGGYIYPLSLTGWTEGEVITGAGGASAVVALVNEDKGRLEVYRRSTDTGAFVTGEVITGGGSATTSTIVQHNVSSGSGAKVFAFSRNIGAVGSINIQTQGESYSSDGHLANSSTFPMLVSAPTVSLSKDTALTGSVTGTTGTVIDYNANTQVLKVRDMDGLFLEGETITYPNSGSFKIHAFNPFTGRGTMAGEGIVNKGTSSDIGHVNASGQAIQDSKFYQSHSYVVRIGESINKWRSIVKDLVHPAGHIFFGEVAVANDVSIAVPDAQHVRFRPTIVINAGGADDEVNAGVTLAARTGERQQVEIYSLANEVGDLAYAPMIAIANAGVPTANTDPRTGGSITEPRTEYGDSSHRQRHINILKIVSKNIASSQTGMWTPGSGVPTTISLESADGTYDPYFVLQTNVNNGPERRPSREGKVIPINPASIETLIFEDNTRIEGEEVVCKLRMEPASNAEVKGDFGKVFCTEDGDTLRLESATTTEETEFFITERSLERYVQRQLQFEDYDTIITEDGDALVAEGTSENAGMSSFVPMGMTFNELNTITGQQTYDIAYYLKQDDGSASNSGTHGDDILLEDGHGALMSEVSKPEGIRISDMENYFPNTFIPKFSDHARHRTNIAYATYIKSGTN